MRYGTNGSAGDNVEISTGRSNREGIGSNTPHSTVTLQPTAKPTLEPENNVEQYTATVFILLILQPQTKLLCDGMAYLLSYITRMEFVMYASMPKPACSGGTKDRPS